MAALGFRNTGHGQGCGLGLGGHGLELGGAALAGVVEVEVGKGAAGEAVLRGQTGIRVFRGEPGHGHGAFDQTGPGSFGQVRGRDGRHAPADEDAQAEIAALLALDLLERAVADADGQGGALGRDGFGGVGAGPEGGGDQVGEEVGGGGGRGTVRHGLIWPDEACAATALIGFRRRRGPPACRRRRTGRRMSGPCRPRDRRSICCR